MSNLEDVLKPGNIVKVCSTINDPKELWGIILNNDEVAYIDLKDGFDRLEEFNDDNYRIIEVYKPLPCFTISKIKNVDCMECLYRVIKHPREVDLGIEYEMEYGGITYTCCNVEVFEEIYIIRKFLSSISICPLYDIEESGIEYIKILEKEE